MRQKSVKNKTGKKFKKLFQIGGCLRNTHTHTHTHTVSGVPAAASGWRGTSPQEHPDPR